MSRDAEQERSPAFFCGLDFGTSGARGVVIDQQRQIRAQVTRQFNTVSAENWPTTWKTTLFELFADIPLELRQSMQAIALNGTSATVLLCDARGQPVTEPLLYNDSRGKSVLPNLRAIASPQHPVLSATSSLAKLLWWRQEWQDGRLIFENDRTPYYFLHQADWLSFLLHGQLGISDYHNALKLGYDVGQLRYPDWLRSLELYCTLPNVLPPGTIMATVQSAIAQQFNLPTTCHVCAGTTDSIAAFLASGATSPGDAVTSLGSTIVLKLLSNTRVDNAHYGIYSHRLGNLWLVGGASNTGGAVLRKFFTDQDLKSLSALIQPDQPSSLDYYPLIQPGERFPINDPDLSPRLDPRPDTAAEFLHGLLDSMARIEAQGYELLQTLGATPLQRLYTAGGGARNLVWQAIRDRRLPVPVEIATQTEAAYGTACLALQGLPV